MFYYDYIIDPITSQKISIHTYKGKHILDMYSKYNQYGGADDTEEEIILKKKRTSYLDICKALLNKKQFSGLTKEEQKFFLTVEVSPREFEHRRFTPKKKKIQENKSKKTFNQLLNENMINNLSDIKLSDITTFTEAVLWISKVGIQLDEEYRKEKNVENKNRIKGKIKMFNKLNTWLTDDSLGPAGGGEGSNGQNLKEAQKKFEEELFYLNITDVKCDSMKKYPKTNTKPKAKANNRTGDLIASSECCAKIQGQRRGMVTKGKQNMSDRWCKEGLTAERMDELENKYGPVGDKTGQLEKERNEKEKEKEKKEEEEENKEKEKARIKQIKEELRKNMECLPKHQKHINGMDIRKNKTIFSYHVSNLFSDSQINLNVNGLIMNKAKFEFLKDIYYKLKIETLLTNLLPVNVPGVEEEDMYKTLCINSIHTDINTFNNILKSPDTAKVEAAEEKVTIPDFPPNQLKNLHDMLFNKSDLEQRTLLLKKLGFSPLIFAACLHNNSSNDNSSNDNIKTIYKLWMKSALEIDNELALEAASPVLEFSKSNESIQPEIIGKYCVKDIIFIDDPSNDELSKDDPSNEAFKSRSQPIKAEFAKMLAKLAKPDSTSETDSTSGTDSTSKKDNIAEEAAKFNPTILHTWPSFKIEPKQYVLFDHFTTPYPADPTNNVTMMDDTSGKQFITVEE